MHTEYLRQVVKVCRQRQSEGDRPTVKGFDAETLEDAVIMLADMAFFGIDPQAENPYAHSSDPFKFALSTLAVKPLGPEGPLLDGRGPTEEDAPGNEEAS